MDIKKLKETLKAAKSDIEAYKASRSGAANVQPSNKGSDSEKKAVAKFGVKSLNELITVNTAARQFKHIGLDQREAVKAIKEAVDVTLMCAKVYGKPVRQTKAYHSELQPALKAFGIDSGDAGYEWIPTLISDSYMEEYNLDRKVAGLFEEIKMPSNPYRFPVMSNGAIATSLAPNTQKSTKDEFSTSYIEFDAKKIAAQFELPEELNEDSAVDVMKVIRAQLISAQEKAMEIAILEGDTAGSHQHTNTQIPGLSGTPASDSSERLFDGLRKRALAVSSLKVDASGVVINESHLRSARKALGKYGVNPAELALICGPKGYNELQDLDDVRTLEQYGPQAPVLTGEMAKYEGIPVIVSEYLREDTDAAGVNGASGNTKSSILLVNRKRYMLGLKRAIQVKVEKYRTAFDTWDMVSFSRRAFNGVLATSSETNVALIYNIL